ncbi:Mu-like prophage major head subunit gpT family protein [Sphingorhabdus sp. 109]|uniref:Mu-like prophage major head subunit gpT family protein n=1 Tax=Sphingorhabdus sp. 109 TaxID=2653173 RepID=UPI0012F05CAE|nr:Mu-like prophage major head subunit gpT family protein [Sphingorhabdus sp. 109]VWX62580.1 Mu-like prophage FluMu major head subunit [Sphingorhabdus sp. 109]
MKINPGNLQTLGTGFSALFAGGQGQAVSQRALVSTTVPSSTAQNEYGWLGKFPGMREWIGDRVINQLKAYDYAIKNKDWEDTIEVDRNDIEDDNIGIYGPLFTEMGRATEAHPDELVFALLKAGFTTKCYDGQFFFDTDHPVLDEDGVAQSVSNTGGGSGAPWFLIDDSRALKPVIFQERKKAQFVAMDNLTDENVFRRKKFQYGVDARYNVGFGFWQYAYGSKQTLDATAFKAAFAALEGMKGDHGRPLGVKPSLLVTGPSNRSAAQKLLNSELASGGETNEWKGTAKLEVVPWLA